MRNARYKLKVKCSIKYILSAVLAAFVCSSNISCNKKTDAGTIPIKDIVEKKKLDAYTEVQYGNMPLIISIPHGGNDEPVSIPDRICPGITTAVDIKTIEMATAIDSVCKA